MPRQVLSRYLATLVTTLAEDYGVPDTVLYGAAGLTPIGAAERMPEAYADTLWAAAERLADERLGLRMAARVRYSSFSALGHLLVTCDTVGESVRMACDYALYVGAGGHFDLTDKGRDCLLTYAPFRPDWPAAQVRSEAVLLPFVRFSNWAAKGVVPSAVYLKRAAPADRTAFEAAFMAPVVFGADHNGILWGAAAWAKPMSDANRPLRDMLRQQVQAELKDSPDLVARISEYLRRRLAHPLGLAGQRRLLAECAGDFGLSARSLQRTLAGTGHSFRAMLAAARQASAERLLRETDASIGDIADHLGYSEPAAFIRAFGRWAGVSPAQFRRRH